MKRSKAFLRKKRGEGAAAGRRFGFFGGSFHQNCKKALKTVVPIAYNKTIDPAVAISCLRGVCRVRCTRKALLPARPTRAKPRVYGEE